MLPIARLLWQRSGNRKELETYRYRDTDTENYLLNFEKRPIMVAVHLHCGSKCRLVCHTAGTYIFI